LNAPCESLTFMRVYGNPLNRSTNILDDIHPGDPRCSYEAHHVAASSAKHILKMFIHGEWMA
jgi:hypothetical protein